MVPSDFNVAETLKEALVAQKPASTFEEVWGESQKTLRRVSGKRKVFSIPLIAIITILACFSMGFASYQYFRIMDNTDYTFVNDVDVIGKWKAVDFVKNITDFEPGKQQNTDGLYLKELVFIKAGKMLSSLEQGNGNLAWSFTNWTKGKVINKQEKTASGYEIKDIDGKSYLFMQWKSGDYVFAGMEPKYYVMEKVDGIDYSDFEAAAKEDNIDYPFENDVQMLGSWESVDFVKEIDNFKPDTNSWPDDLYLIKIKIMDDGEASVTTTDGKYLAKGNFWTKGLLISKTNKTASKCTIKEIDGSTYMFYEWKSGDYTFRGMKPKYYVLKKVG